MTGRIGGQGSATPLAAGPANFNAARISVAMLSVEERLKNSKVDKNNACRPGPQHGRTQ